MHNIPIRTLAWSFEAGIILLLLNQIKMEATYTRPPSYHSEYLSDLIESCRKGDHKSMLRLYKIFYKPVFRSILLRVGDHHEAEYLMQESFLTAFENIGSFKGETSFIEWLFTNIKQA
jgi:hypothetical protein